MTAFAYAMLFRSEARDLPAMLTTLDVSSGTGIEVVAFDKCTAEEFDRVRGVFGWEAAERVLGGSPTTTNPA